ncbi:MAG TPA: aldo/keto reductase [Candidatus Baltobacteraceae bacterium]|jgi:aryl-alcohol dehydrogenase-like predicted oxidoreductase|nr:aldo/keto reductase [Candidatus Baltobacteraceae bacterium]
MDVTRTAFGAWNGGRFMNFGQPLSDERWIALARRAFDQGVRTFVTADVYGSGAADELLAMSLAGLPRNDYCLVGAVGHDFYKGQRQGPRGFPRFTDPALRQPRDYADYLRMATEKSLARCRAAKFDLLLLHNPDFTGYSSDRVWSGMDSLIDAKLTDRIGVAPGPANGFTLDLILCLERFGPLLDWGMIILNPLEPWPGQLVLPAAVKQDIKLITRVVDYGGLFHGDVKTGHKFGPHDHRTFRPAGWVEAGNASLDQMRAIAEKHNLTLLQLACAWNLSQPPVKSVVPTLIQEDGGEKSIESKLDELSSLPDVSLTEEDLQTIGRVGDNRGCMALKGANRSHTTAPEADRWAISQDLEAVGKRWGIDPDHDLAFTHAGQP